MGVAVGAGAVAGGAALFGLATKAAGTTDRIDKMSQKVGLSRQGFQEWDFIMSQSGLSVDKMQVGMKTLVNRMDEASTGTGKGADAFKALGLSAVDSSGNLKSQEQMFEETVLALQEMEDGTEKAALANELLGKAGIEMMPLLNGAAGSVDEMKAKAHELGLVMSDEAVDSGVLFTDTMDQAQRMLGTVVAQIGVGVMPMFQTFMEWVMEHMPTIQAVFKAVFDVIAQVVTVVVDVFTNYLMPVFRQLFDWVQTNWPTIKATIMAVFDAIKAHWELVLKPVFSALIGFVRDVLIPAIEENFPKIRDAAVNVFNKIKEVWETTLKPALDALMAFVRDTLVPTIQEWMPKIQKAAETVFEKIKEFWNNVLKPVLNELIAFIRDTLVPKVEEWMPKIQKAVETVFNAIKTVWDTVLKPVLEAVWNFIEDVLYPAFSTVFDGIKIAVETAFDAVGVAIDVVTGIFEGIKTTIDNVSEWFGGLRDGITNAINAARDAVDAAITKIKEFFGFKFEWPKLTLPRFGITPEGWKVSDLLKGSIPKIGVKWNAEGGIFDEPTIFGTARGLQGVGEAGPEAIMPLSRLQEMLDWNSDKVLLQEMVNLLKDIKAKNSNVLLDGNKLVGGVYDRIDEMVAFKQRENEKAYGG